MKTRLATAALVLAGCDFTAFDSYRSHSAVLTIAAPSQYPNTEFGEAMGIASDDGNNVWLVASGGLGTAVIAIPLYVNRTITPSQPTLQTICTFEDPNSCAMINRFGIGLAGISSWNGATMCGMTGAFGTVHEVFISCFGGSATQTFTVRPPAGFEQAGFGLAIAAPMHRRADDPPTQDLIVVGANAGTGHVFVAQPSGVTNITPATGVGWNSLGDTVAVGRIRTGGTTDLLVAAGGGAGRSVLVWRGDPRAGRAMQPIGCIAHSDEPGFGGALALGDLDGDGSDDVIVGSAANTTDRMQNVYVFSTAAAPSNATCDATSWPSAARISCADDTTRNVHCSGMNAGFGSALAAADLDGDGRDELAIGAPHATVESSADAGAVWLYYAAGGSSSLALTVATVLRASVPDSGALLGGVLQAAHLGTRDELLASAAGSLAIKLYLCTGIPGDTPGGSLTIDCR